MNFVHTYFRIPLTIFLSAMFITAVVAQTPNNKPSDLKTGSVLVFPYYSSDTTVAPIVRDTRMTIHNHGTATVDVHLYFIENKDCQQADMTVTLTANASITLLASSDIPDETGYLIAVALGTNGVVPNAGLAGNAFVKSPAGSFGTGSGAVLGNYGAMTFNAYASIPVVNNQIELNFDGINLDLMPSRFAAEIQRPLAAPGQSVVMAGLNGSVITGEIVGAAQVGLGEAYNADEVFRSYSRFLNGKCQVIAEVTTNSPRVLSTPPPLGTGTGLNGLIAIGTNGTLKFNTLGGVGLLITPANSSGWSGIRSLTCLATTDTVTLIVPSF